MYQLPLTDNALRPREKLDSQGVGVLTNAELLAMILNTGTKRERIMDLAQRIMKDYGFSALANVTDYQRLSASLQISCIKAMQIVAVLELGRRLYLERMGKRPLLNTPQKVIQHFKYMENKTREEVRALYVNSRQMLVLNELIAIGGIDIVNCQVRDILAPALEYGASGIILLHNHPSGDPSPSNVDIGFTEGVARGAKILQIKLLDHIIIARNGYFSFLEGGLLTDVST